MSKLRPRHRGLPALAPFLWLAAFFLFPFVLVAKLSLSDIALAMPPYAPRLDLSKGLDGVSTFLHGLDFDAYRHMVEDGVYAAAYLSSLKFATIGTGILLLVGYPMAYGMARCPPKVRQALLMMVVLPFWTSFLIRIYAWIAILKPEGLLNAALGWLGLPPVALMDNDPAVIIGLVYAYLPYW